MNHLCLHMSRIVARFVVGGGILLNGQFAWAHPGHGTSDSQSLTHFVTEPLHVVPAILLVSGIALALLAYRRHRR